MNAFLCNRILARILARPVRAAKSQRMIDEASGASARPNTVLRTRN